MIKYLFAVFLFLSGAALPFMATGGERTAIPLSPAERDLVLAEMRVFLESVQKVVAGVAGEDMAVVESSARKSGRAAQEGIPASLARKLPMPFKKLGADTHRKFDELALDAGSLGDKEHTLSQLGHLLENCVACHSMYRIEGQ